MIRKLAWLFTFASHFGVLGLLTFFIPVYWEQDMDFKNGGHDIWSWKQTERSFARTVFQNRYKGMFRD